MFARGVLAGRGAVVDRAGGEARLHHREMVQPEAEPAVDSRLDLFVGGVNPARSLLGQLPSKAHELDLLTSVSLGFKWQWHKVSEAGDV